MSDRSRIAVDAMGGDEGLAVMLAGVARARRDFDDISFLLVGDEEAIRDACEWVRHFEQIDPDRRRVYRCIETLLDLGSADGHRSALQHLYGAATVATAEAMLRQEQRFFGIETPGMGLKGCDLHQRLLAAYAKLRH